MEFKFLKTKNIRIDGWILKQLKLQSEGLVGNLDNVWPDVKDSKWLGGEHEGWERFPYFLDGYIPMAYLLRDNEKISRCERYIDKMLSTQAEDGCFYPKGDEGKNGDIWSLFLINKMLVVYADCSGDEEKILKAVYDCLKFLDKYINHNPPFSWAAARWYECIIPIMWVYERRKEDWLIYLAKRLKALGTNFEASIKLWDRTVTDWAFDTHVVNIAMALKSEAVYCEATGEKITGLAERMTQTLFKYHGTAYGHFTGDECLSGNSPSHGSELCGVVEAMYSYEWLLAITGDAKWGDMLEKLAFNGLPASVSGDMWTHQYDQQVNQIACTRFDKQIFFTNNNEANMFGLEPNFGCCTANFGQGWPKYILSSYMMKGDKLVVMSPLPANITTDKGITVTCKSEYPFRKRFTLTANEDTDVLVRIPSYVKGKIKDRAEHGYIEVHLKKGVASEFEFDMAPVLTERNDGRKCVYYGPLLFSLPIEYKKEMFEYERDGIERKYPYCDYTFTPTSEWRYAFAGDKFEVEECEYDKPYDKINPPLKLKGTFAPVEWDFEEGYDLTASEKAGTKRTGENVSKEMVPYGATYLRVTEMSLIK